MSDSKVTSMGKSRSRFWNPAVAPENDKLRRHPTGQPLALSTGVYTSPDCDLILTAVRDFSDFTDENDPYGEHECGRFLVNGTLYFWKSIYLYDEFQNFRADANRVLMIGRVDEF